MHYRKLTLHVTKIIVKLKVNTTIQLVYYLHRVETILLPKIASPV